MKRNVTVGLNDGKVEMLISNDSISERYKVFAIKTKPYFNCNNEKVYLTDEEIKSMNKMIGINQKFITYKK